MKAGWLTAAAMLAMGAAMPAGAVTRHKLVGKTHARQPAPTPVVASAAAPAVWQAPVAPALADNRWLDDADALMTLIGDNPPDLTFSDEGMSRYAWQLADGALVVAEPMGPGDTRFYFFDADMTAPFLVRDRLYAYGFDRGRLAAVYDGRGKAVRWAADDGRDSAAADLYARGRRLWFAARIPAQVAPRPAKRAILLEIVADLGRWRDDDGWRERRRERHDRDRRDFRDRRAHDGPRAPLPAVDTVARQPSDDRTERHERPWRDDPFRVPSPVAAAEPVAFTPAEPSTPVPERATVESPRRNHGEGGRRAVPAVNVENDTPRPPSPPSPQVQAPVPEASPAPPAPEATRPPQERRAEPDEGARPESAREERRPRVDPEAVERPE